jgi:hypothetical protein
MITWSDPMIDFLVLDRFRNVILPYCLALNLIFLANRTKALFWEGRTRWAVIVMPHSPPGAMAA